MHKHRIRFWLWTALSAAAWVTAGFLIAIRWQGSTATFNGPFNSANAAAWVQAVGSLVAIGIAIYIPRKLARDENQRREADRVQRARLLAAKLLVPTINLRFEALRLQACLLPLPAGKDHSAPIYWNHGTPHRLDDIESIKKEWGELAVLDRLLGEKFAILITVVDAYNRRFDSLSRDSHHLLASARLARESPELAQMAASIAELAELTHDSARQQSLLALPESYAVPSWAQTG